MRIDIVTVFPEMVEAALDHSIIKRARERGLMAIHVVNLRDYTTDKHRTTDDTPYGGGGGMVMKIEPIFHALQALTAQDKTEYPPEADNPGILSDRQDAVSASLPSGIRVALTDPRGQRFTQETARKWALEPHLIILCGHYEGVDERVRQHLVTDEVSIGDYILTGGELPALIIADALTRLQPDALGDEFAPDKDTFSDNLLEYPHYTRPRSFRGWDAPNILVNGHHAHITRWRRWHQLHATRERRPDLFATLELSPQDTKLLASEEPTAPYDAKIAKRAAKTPKPESAADRKGKQEDTTDGTGTGNNT